MVIEMLKVSCSTNGPENPNMMYTREDTIRSGKVSELGHKTWDPGHHWVHMQTCKWG